MVLESTIICVDNSEFMRNGDFIPTRLQAQQDAVSLVCHAKLRSNPENNVALLTLGGHPEVLATLTTDVGRLLGKLHLVQTGGEMNFLTGIRVAHLALKHRQGKNHKMRIVAFVGSPVDTEEKEMVKLAKKLKKEKVNVDIINFGEEVINTDKLSSFIKILDGTPSHMVTVPSGSLLSDALFSSPVVLGEDGAGAGANLSGGFEFGIDPNEDPELALALRVSMEEQRQRQEEEARAAAAASTTAPASGTGATTSAPAASGAAISTESTGESTQAAAAATAGSSSSGGTSASIESVPAGSTTEEEMLEKALAMSLETDFAGGASGGRAVDIAAMTEEEQIQYAMQMSLQAPMEGDSSTESSGEKAAEGEEEPMETDDPSEKGESKK